MWRMRSCQCERVCRRKREYIYIHTCYTTHRSGCWGWCSCRSLLTNPLCVSTRHLAICFSKICLRTSSMSSDEHSHLTPTRLYIYIYIYIYTSHQRWHTLFLSVIKKIIYIYIYIHIYIYIAILFTAADTGVAHAGFESLYASSHGCCACLRVQIEAYIDMHIYIYIYIYIYI